MCLKKKVSNGLFLVSGSDDLQVYRYNEEKMLSWLQSKVCVMSLWHTFPIPSYLNQPSIGSQKGWSHDSTSLYNVAIHTCF